MCMLCFCLQRIRELHVAIHKTTSNEFQSFISKWEHGSQIFFKQAFPHIDIFLRTINQRTLYKNTQQMFLFNIFILLHVVFSLETINNQNSLLIIHYYVWCLYFPCTVWYKTSESEWLYKYIHCMHVVHTCM